MKWAVEIQKTSLEKRNLKDLLRGLGFELIDGIEYSELSSSTFDECETAVDVFEIAKSVRAAFTGVAQIDPEFVLGSVVDYSTNPPRRSAFLEVESCALTTTMGDLTLAVSPPSGLSITELESWREEYKEQKYQAALELQRSRLEPVYRNSKAAKVMELLSYAQPTAEALYKIYELVEDHPTNRSSFHQEFKISQEQFNRFRDAVHNPSVSGDWARHAYHEKQRTPNPMTKGEAETFIRDIAASWLKSLR